jgi:hypothetical protein
MDESTWLVGYGLHPLLDSLTKDGCALFYPFGRRRYLRDLVGPERRRQLFSGGSGTERRLAFLPILLAALDAWNNPRTVDNR